MTAVNDVEGVEEEKYVIDPVSLNIAGAMQFTGFKESRLRALARTGVVPVKYQGTQQKHYYVFLTAGLREYVNSLPDDPSELPEK